MSAVPKLRFSEFDGEWEKRSLGAVSEKPFYGMNSEATSFDGLNKYIRITDIDETTRKFGAAAVTSPSGGADAKYKLKEGDIVFARTGASVGKSYLYNEDDGNLLFAGFLIKFHISKANPKFVFFYTLTSQYGRWVIVNSARSGQPGINAEEYKLLEISFPSLPEQQKIASFLSSVDKKIDLLRQKKDAIELYKKGLMQKIFSQETRFKQDDGSDFPEWEEVTLKDAVYMKSGGTPKSTVETYYNGSIRFLSISDFSGGEKYLHSVKKRISEDGLKNSSARLFGKDTLIFAMYASVGECAILKTEAAISQAVLGMTPCSESINIELIYYTLRHERCKFIRFVQEGTQGNLSKSIVEKFKIQLPSKKEQKKIVDYLSAVDTKIQNTSAQIEQMETFKKGLLQQMFV